MGMDRWRGVGRMETDCTRPVPNGAVRESASRWDSVNVEQQAVGVQGGLDQTGTLGSVILLPDSLG